MKLFLIITSFLLLALRCDSEHRNKCEWYLIPDLDYKADPASPLAEGEIPVCARNFTINKQDCRFTADLEFARKAYNVRFQYSELVFIKDSNPRKIKEIKPCK